MRRRERGSLLAPAYVQCLEGHQRQEADRGARGDRSCGVGLVVRGGRSCRRQSRRHCRRARDAKRPDVAVRAAREEEARFRGRPDDLVNPDGIIWVGDFLLEVLPVVAVYQDAVDRTSSKGTCCSASWRRAARSLPGRCCMKPSLPARHLASGVVANGSGV